MIVIDVCLSDIPQDKITVGKNGKKYTKFVVDNRKDPDSYGNTHSVSMSQTKEQRDARDKKLYVGNGKEYNFSSKPKDYEQLPDESPKDFWM